MRTLVIFLAIVLFASGCVDSNNTNEQPSSQNIDLPQTNDTSSNESNSSNTKPSENPSTVNTKSFDITVSHVDIRPSQISVNRGDNVIFNVKTSPGTESHNHGITIDAYNINVANTDSDVPTMVEFTADKSGEFEIYCKTCWDGPYGRGHPAITATLKVI